jgi:magnesium transporter
MLERLQRARLLELEPEDGDDLNDVMKFLASVTIVLLIPQIIGAFYGMNVMLPIEDVPSAFYILVGLSAVLSAIVAFILWKKDWR